MMRRVSTRKDIDALKMLAIFFFITTFALKVFTDGPYLRGEISSSIAYLKYATALIACLFGFCIVIKSGGQIFKHEFADLLGIMAIFLLSSSILQAIAQTVSSTVYVELIKLAMPMVLSYCMLNCLDEKTIYKCFEIILVLSFIAYLIDLSSEGVSLSDIMRADFLSSDSPTEHAGLSDISLVLSFFFLFYSNKKWPAVLSIIFCLLTFKRLAMIMVLLVTIIAVLFPHLRYKNISHKLIFLSKIFSLLAVALWFWILLPEQERFFVDLFKETPFNFTSGRSGIMRWLLDSHFSSYGFGSINATVKPLFGVPFEMDFIKIAIELTPFTLVCFIWLFWNITRDNVWPYLIVAFYVLNMITSDCLNSNFSFTLAYMVIGIVNYQLEKKRELFMPQQDAGGFE